MMEGYGFPKNKVITASHTEIPEEERDYYLERRYPAFGNLVPRDVASRAAKERCDAGYGVGSSDRPFISIMQMRYERYGKVEVQ